MTMNILIVGAWYTNIYEEPLAKGFENLGCSVHKFKWAQYFRNAHLEHYQTEKLNKAEIFYYKTQNKLLFGPIMRRINNDLLKKCQELQPDLVFFYRGTHVRKSTISKIKASTNATLVSFHNDDPFASGNRRQSRNYIVSLGLMDWNYVYREKNLQDIRKYTKHCEILLPYPNTDFIYPLEKVGKKYDVVFVGHYEDDGRENAICDLIADRSINFRLFGTGWQNSAAYGYIKDQLGEIAPVYHDGYNRTLNEAKIALCFLSTLNNDRYTRRTFEIPAAGTLLLSQYTDESASLLAPGEEAAYFTNREEVISKVKVFLSDNALRERVARNGYKKIVYGGHTYTDRAKQILDRKKRLTMSDLSKDQIPLRSSSRFLTTRL